MLGHFMCQLLSYLVTLHVALVDAPDMVRSQMNFKRHSLTDIKIDIKVGPQEEGISLGVARKLIVQMRRANLNDFDRFKLMLAKIKRASLVKSELAKLKKQSA
ncbi:putative ribosomal protein L14e [Rosa chinensis]|uniref:Putative ribosomal protein L14e n=1 Tax=Rosa chinensis TaxID=74649 RepID=A0A2P6QR41_ROSCH|nr:putative ribosomal protein L14e [Rosa chinensis]